MRPFQNRPSMIYIWFMPSYTCQQQIGRRPCVHPSKSQYSRSQYRMSPRLRQRKTAFHTRAPGRPNKKRGVLLIASRFGSKYGRGLVSLMKPPLYHSITRQTSILSNITIMPAARSCWLTRCVDLAGHTSVFGCTGARVPAGGINGARSSVLARIGVACACGYKKRGISIRSGAVRRMSIIYIYFEVCMLFSRCEVTGYVVEQRSCGQPHVEGVFDCMLQALSVGFHPSEPTRTIRNIRQMITTSASC